MQVLSGSVWIFGDNISTEYMMPGHVMLAKMDDEEAKKHCMSAIRPEFAGNVRPGDILVAGENFGCGSSRLGFRLLQALGVSCVVARSFAGIFFRNALSGGLPLVEHQDILSLVKEGDRCRIALEAGTIKNLSNGLSVSFVAMPAELQRILDAGGIIPLLKRELASQTRS